MESSDDEIMQNMEQYSVGDIQTQQKRKKKMKPIQEDIDVKSAWEILNELKKSIKVLPELYESREGKRQRKELTEEDAGKLLCFSTRSETRKCLSFLINIINIDSCGQPVYIKTKIKSKLPSNEIKQLLQHKIKYLVDVCYDSERYYDQDQDYDDCKRFVKDNSHNLSTTDMFVVLKTLISIIEFDKELVKDISAAFDPHDLCRKRGRVDAYENGFNDSESGDAMSLDMSSTIMMEERVKVLEVNLKETVIKVNEHDIMLGKLLISPRGREGGDRAGWMTVRPSILRDASFADRQWCQPGCVVAAYKDGVGPIGTKEQSNVQNYLVVANDKFSDVIESIPNSILQDRETFVYYVLVIVCAACAACVACMSVQICVI
jgi:hypothetical protein